MAQVQGISTTAWMITEVCLQIAISHSIRQRGETKDPGTGPAALH
jgi:hypothetical protein